MKQLNKTLKSIVALIAVLFCVYQSYAQAPISFGSPFVRSWRSYQQFPPTINANAALSSSPLDFFQIGDTIYSFGESYYAGASQFEFNVKTFDPNTNSWAYKTNSSIAYRNGYIKFVIGNNLYLGCGYQEKNPYPGFSDSTIYRYNSINNSWTTVASFPDSTLALPVCFTLNNRGYVLGGFNCQNGFVGNINTNTRYYDEVNNVWINDDNTPVQMSVDGGWKAFTNNGKAYLFSTRSGNNALFEFDPNAATGNKWIQKTTPNTPDSYDGFSLLETTDGCKLVGGNYQAFYDDGTSSYSYTDYVDSIYNYSITNNTWEATTGIGKISNSKFATVLNNELFLFSTGSIQNINTGYGDSLQSGYYNAYIDNAFLSLPLDSVKVNHNFAAICSNNTTTVSYSVSKHLNADNKFYIVLTRQDGYIIDTLGVVNDSISGSMQVTMPSTTDVYNKSGGELTHLKLAVLTTSPRTIFKNEGKSFSLLDDPASLLISLNYANDYTCPGTPLKITSRLFKQSTYSYFEPTTTNWGSVYGGQAPTNNTINVLESDPLANDLNAPQIYATKNFFCYNVDTTFTYGPIYAYLNRKSNPILNSIFTIQEGNSICVGGNETKHLIAQIGPFYDGFGDTTAVNVVYSKNGIVFYNKIVNVVHDGSSLQDTITLNGVNSNDELEVKTVYNSSLCSNTNVDSISRTILFKNYENNLSSDKMLQYNFNNNLVDSTSNHNNGIGENIAFTTDRFGHTNSALRIYRDTTSTNISQVVSDSFVNITGNQARTVSFWFKTDSLGYHYTTYYGGSYQNPSAPAVLGWGTVTGSNSGSGSFMHIFPETKAVFFNGNQNYLSTPHNVFKFNEWTHVAFVYDSSNFNLYVNGKCQAHSFDYSTTTSTNGYYSYNNTLNTTNTPLTIGNNGTGVDINGVYNAPFDGSIDDILIYDKAMTACQIDSLYRRVDGSCTPTTHLINASICAGKAYLFKSINRTTAGTYKDTLVNAIGCDSIVTLNLTIKAKSFKTIDTAVCNSYLFKGVVRTTSATLKDTLTNATGCDSIVTLNLTIKQKSSSTISAGVCAGDAYIFNGKNLTLAGTYKDTLTNANGCDSIVTLNLKINVAKDTTLYRAICAGQSLTMFGETYTTAGPHYITRTNAADCDSNITLIVILKQPTSSIKYDTICNTMLPFTWNGLTFTAAGAKTKTGLVNAAGCDSTATLDLTIKQTSSKTIYDTINAGSSYSFNANTYTATGVYVAYLKNAVNCDSAITLNLFVKAGVAATITGNFVGCSFITTNSLRASIGGGNWRSSNNGVATINQFGVVTSISNGITTITYTYYKNGQPIISTVTFTVAVQSALNATSGPTLVCAGSSITLTNTSTIPSGGMGVWSSVAGRATINTSGILTGTSAGSALVNYTVINALGCSALVSRNITVFAIPAMPQIAYGVNTINPTTAGGFCTNRTINVVGVPSGGVWSKTGVINVTNLGVVTTGNTPSVGALIYTTTDANGCSNNRIMNATVVACAARQSVVNSQLSLDLMNNDFTMYPNPARTFISLNVNQLIGSGSIVVTDLYGKIVKTQPLSMGTNTVDIAKFAKGMYFLSTITNEGKTTKKLVVE